MGASLMTNDEGHRLVDFVGGGLATKVNLM